MHHLARPSARPIRRAIRLAGLVALAALLASPALAEEPEAAEEVVTGEQLPSTDLDYLYDRADYLLRRGRYAEAADRYQELVRLDPGNMQFRLDLALCLYQSGRLEQAKEIYDEVRDAQPTNTVALLQSARISAAQAGQARDDEAREELLGDARGHLRRAARHGANVLRAIRTYEELKRHFADDVELQLRLIRAPQQHRTPSRVRDPFQNPVPHEDDPQIVVQRGREPRADRLTPDEQREIVRRLRTLIEEIDRLIEERDYDGIAEAWLEFEEILERQDAINVIDLLPELEEIQQKAAERVQLVKGLILRAFAAQGDRIISRMESAVRAGDYLEVYDQSSLLEQHTRRMIEADADFTRPANDLRARGEQLVARANVLEEIARFRFDISGIVAGAGVAKAIVNDRILTEDDVVYAVDGVPIPDLRVVEIKRRRVRFSYMGTQFERPLLEQ